jgi:hypothetical protein
MQLGNFNARLLGLVIAIAVGGPVAALIGPLGIVVGLVAAAVVVGALGNGNAAGGAMLLALFALVASLFDQVDKVGWGTALAIDIPCVIAVGVLIYFLVGRLPRIRGAARMREYATGLGWPEREADAQLVAAVKRVQQYVEGPKSFFFVASGLVNEVPAALTGIIEGWATRQTGLVAQMPTAWPPVTADIGGTSANFPTDGVPTLRGIGRVTTKDLGAANRLLSPEFVRQLTRNEITVVAVEGNQLAVLFDTALTGEKLANAVTALVTLVGLAAEAGAAHDR